MKGPAPNANARRVTGRRERLTNERHYRLSRVSQAIRAVWRQEAARLLSEHRRTANAAHLKHSVFIGLQWEGGYIEVLCNAYRDL